MKLLKIFIKNIVVLFLMLLIWVIPIQRVYAYKIITAQDVNFDTSITREDINYNLQKQIIIAPIYGNESTLLNGEELYKGLYFYTVSRLGFSDIPFHYVVTEKGDVFKGNQGNDERKIRVGDLGDNAIVIAYLTNKSALSFDNRSLTSLKELILDLANKNQINASEIKTSGIKFVRNESTKSVLIEDTQILGRWNTDLEQIQDFVAENYSPSQKQYSIQVEATEIKTQNITSGQTVDMSVTLKNTGNNAIYAGSDNEVIFNSQNSVSRFFLNNEWLSTSQFGIMEDNQVLKPNESAKFDFKVKAPLFVGKIDEQFSLKTISGQSVSGGDLVISLDIQRSPRRIVEILQTETGALRVRATASSVGEEISQVAPGERFFVTEDAGNGWIQIELSDGTRGWIAGWYTRDI